MSTKRLPNRLDADLGALIRALPKPLTVDLVRSEFTDQDMIEIRPTNTRADVGNRTDAATATNVDRGRRHATRAAELRAEGLSAPTIGIRMANDEGRPARPYGERTVRRWLQAPKG